MSTAHKRTPITVQADPGRDADLIAWVGNIPDGQKQQRIKEVIRRGIAAERRDRDALKGVDDIRSNLDGIRRDLGGLAAVLQQQTGKGGAGISVSEIERVIKQALAGFALAPPSDEGDPPVESSPRLDESEIAERAAAIRSKARWKR